MSYLPALRDLIETSSLDDLRPQPGDLDPPGPRRPRVGVRGLIGDALAKERIGIVEAFTLLCECDARLARESGDPGTAPEPAPAEPVAPEPVRPPLPPLLILDDFDLAWCARQRWNAGPVRSAETAWEQLSRVENYALAIAMTPLQASDDPRDDRIRDAIWAAVSLKVEQAVARTVGRPRRSVPEWEASHVG